MMATYQCRGCGQKVLRDPKKAVANEIATLECPKCGKSDWASTKEENESRRVDPWLNQLFAKIEEGRGDVKW